MKLTSVFCKLEIKINLSKSKVKLHPYSKSISTNQMCNLALIQNQYAPPNVESGPYSKSICTTCQDLNQGPSACKLSVQTTTTPVLDSILIEQQELQFYLDSSTHPDYPLISKVLYTLEFYERQTFS